MLRVTRQHTDVLTKGDGSLRVASQHIAVLADDRASSSDLQVTRQVVQALVAGASSVRVARQWVGVLIEEPPVDAFKHCINVAGLSNDSEGQEALIHALLQYADANHMGQAILCNPMDEVIRRLEILQLNPNAMAYIRQLLSDVSERYSRMVR